MKITKRQLKRIIREEKQKLLNEVAQGVIAGVGFGSRHPTTGPSVYSHDGSQNPASLAMRRRLHQDTVQEFFGQVGSSTRNDGDVSFEWDPSGLEMQMLVNGQKVMGFMRQRQVEELIKELEDLLAGPMRTSP